MHEYVYRTINMDPPAYERELAQKLFEIMGKSVHDLPGIVAGLNAAASVTRDGQSWTVDSFKEQMRAMGNWTNCVGAPVGTHAVPSTTRRIYG